MLEIPTVRHYLFQSERFLMDFILGTDSTIETLSQNKKIYMCNPWVV